MQPAVAMLRAFFRLARDDSLKECPSVTHDGMHVDRPRRRVKTIWRPRGGWVSAMAEGGVEVQLVLFQPHERAHAAMVGTSDDLAG